MSIEEGRAHSPYGPSSAERWLLCPASVNATKDLPDADSPYAIEGTAAHTLSEWTRQLDVSTTHFRGKKIPVKKVDGSFIDVEITEEMISAVQGYVDRVNEAPGDQLIEARVSYEDFVPDGWGTSDAAVMGPGIAVVTDLKYGKGVQKYAENNPQLMLYALGVFLEYNWLYDFQEFVLVVDQPRLDHYDQWPIRTEALLDWADTTLRKGYAATLDPNAPFNPGEVQCQFCKIRATCRARAESVFKAAVGEFDDLDAAAAAPCLTPATLSNDEIARALSALPNLTAWAKAIKEYAMKEVQQGRAVGDYKLVAGKSIRLWGVHEDMLKDEWMAAGLSLDQLVLQDVVTMPAAEKLIGKKHEFWKTEGLVVTSRGKPTLAPGSDKRPALVLDPKEEFTNLEEDE